MGRWYRGIYSEMPDWVATRVDEFLTELEEEDDESV